MSAPLASESNRAQHDLLVEFLEQQDELNRGSQPTASVAKDYLLFEPTVLVRPEHIHIGAKSRIDSFCKLEGGEGLTIGRFVHIASFVHLGIGGGRLDIDDFAAVASGGRIITGSNQIDALSMSACAPAALQRVKRSFVHLCPYSVVLTNAVVLPGVTLGEGAVLAAGAVATKNIPPWEIWAGVPAKFLAKRETQA